MPSPRTSKQAWSIGSAWARRATHIGTGDPKLRNLGAPDSFCRCTCSFGRKHFGPVRGGSVTRDDVLQSLGERGATLVVRGSSLRYVGPTTLVPDDPIRAAIQEHRDELIALLSSPRADG